MRKLIVSLVISWCLILNSLIAEQTNQVFDTVFGKRDKEFVIVIPSYNNREWYQHNIDSALNQAYEHFQVIYIDDASTDGTGHLVEQYIKQHPRRDRITLIRNKERLGAMLNRYRVFHTIADHKIICELDGDDWYADENVLTRLNKEYADPNVWLTFGQFKRVPNNTIGQSHPIAKPVLDNNVYRVDGYYTSMLRTYYAWLYKKINLQDLLFKGKPFSTGTDIATMYPMVEMAVNHARYIDDVLYIVNRYNELNTENVIPTQEREMNDRIIRQYKHKYQPITDLSKEFTEHHQQTIGAILYSHKTPRALKKTLKSMQHRVQLNKMIIVYAATPSTLDAYEQIKTKYKNFTFLQLCPDTTLKALLLQSLTDLNTDFVLLGTDERIFTHKLESDAIIKVMNQTSAHAFYSTVAKNIHRPYADRKLLPHFITLTESGEKHTIYGWQLSGGLAAWHFPRNLDMTIYRRSIAENLINLIEFKTFSVLRYVWARIIDLDSVVLAQGRAAAQQNPLIIEEEDLFDTYEDPYCSFVQITMTRMIDQVKKGVSGLWSRVAFGALLGSAAALGLHYQNK